MIKWTIKYTDFDDEERQEDYYFNLTKSELMEMNFSADGGLEKTIQKIVEAKDTKRIIDIFKDVVLRSYGEKSIDGKGFIKMRDGHKLADDFAQTAAYDALFMELATNEESASRFINGVIPKGFAKEVEKRTEPVGLPQG